MPPSMLGFLVVYCYRVYPYLSHGGATEMKFETDFIIRTQLDIPSNIDVCAYLPSHRPMRCNLYNCAALLEVLSRTAKDKFSLSVHDIADLIQFLLPAVGSPHPTTIERS